MKLVANSLFILGFCVATVGGAGFADPIEGMAIPLFAGGLAAMFVAGLWLRRMNHAAAGAHADGALSEAGLAQAITSIRDQVAALEERAATLDSHQLCEAIDTILRGPCFDLGARNEDYMRVLGNATYVRYWDGFAVGERLLARAWSMSADGAVEQARSELPWSLTHFRRAVA